MAKGYPKSFMLAAAVAALTIAAPASAQLYSDGFQFLQAVEKQDQATVNTLLDGNATIINSRDITSGRTALHIATDRRDLAWIGFLLGKGANPNITDKNGISPLMLASQTGFVEGVRVLAARGARVDTPNRAGETPLISAVHRRDMSMIRVLLSAGANPDRNDNSGRSAREYAQLDGDGSQMLAEMDRLAKPVSEQEKPPANLRAELLTMSGTAAADLTLDELRIALAPEIAQAAVFDGWSEAALRSASEAADVEFAVARLAFPGGAMDMIAAWVDSVDARMDAAFSREVLCNMPIRERIRSLVMFRLECAAGLEEAVRRGLAEQAMPQNVGRTLKLGWGSADRMWRLAGDTATDYNHYTKRTILAGIYAATLAVFIEDESPDKADTRAFLDRRIEGVMKFEKAKAQLLKRGEHFDVMRFLGRLRYPAR